MSLYPPPSIIKAEVWTTIPDQFRVPNTSPAWAAANRQGHKVDGFLEGPSFDLNGNLWVTDIPYGRIFRISPAADWTLVAEYDGWPNGLKIHQDRSVWVADYKRGILRLEPATGEIHAIVTHRHSESFRGVNDLVFDSAGKLYFTDQGQSGMHLPNGRVYRYEPRTDHLDLLIDTGQSPNGLVLNEHEDMLYVAMTRGNSLWRLPLMADGSASKVGVFVQLSGGLSGPDGMARDAHGGVWAAHAGNGCVWGFSEMGLPEYRIVSPTGLMTTNVAFAPDASGDLYITESDTGNILRAKTPTKGALMFSHK